MRHDCLGPATQKLSHNKWTFSTLLCFRSRIFSSFFRAGFSLWILSFYRNLNQIPCCSSAEVIHSWVHSFLLFLLRCTCFLPSFSWSQLRKEKSRYKTPSGMKWPACFEFHALCLDTLYSILFNWNPYLSFPFLSRDARRTPADFQALFQSCHLESNIAIHEQRLHLEYVSKFHFLYRIDFFVYKTRRRRHG